MKFETSPDGTTEKMIYEAEDGHGHLSLFAELDPTSPMPSIQLQLCLDEVESDDKLTVLKGTNSFGDKVTVTVDVVPNPSPTAPKGHG